MAGTLSRQPLRRDSVDMARQARDTLTLLTAAQPQRQPLRLGKHRRNRLPDQIQILRAAEAVVAVFDKGHAHIVRRYRLGNAQGTAIIEPVKFQGVCTQACLITHRHWRYPPSS